MWLDGLVSDLKPQRAMPGIYRFEGELLLWCAGAGYPPFDSNGNYPNRPKDFVSNKENRQTIWILRPGKATEQVGNGGPMGRRWPHDEKPPYPAVGDQWRIICQVEEEEATCPVGKTAWIIAHPQRLSKDLYPRAINALAYGPLVFSENPAWLDEVRREERELQIRRGLCRRQGDCLLWVVAPTWEKYTGYWKEPANRPSSFTATKENEQVLRVLYLPAKTEKPR